MKHAKRITTPAPAISLIEADGLSQFLARLFATLTAGVSFYNLIARPPHEIANDQKGL